MLDLLLQLNVNGLSFIIISDNNLAFGLRPSPPSALLTFDLGAVRPALDVASAYDHAVVGRDHPLRVWKTCTHKNAVHSSIQVL